MFRCHYLSNMLRYRRLIARRRPVLQEFGLKGSAYAPWLVVFASWRVICRFSDAGAQLVFTNKKHQITKVSMPYFVSFFWFKPFVSAHFLGQGHARRLPSLPRLGPPGLRCKVLLTGGLSTSEQRLSDGPGTERAGHPGGLVEDVHVVQPVRDRSAGGRWLVDLRYKWGCLGMFGSLMVQVSHKPLKISGSRWIVPTTCRSWKVHTIHDPGLQRLYGAHCREHSRICDTQTLQYSWDAWPRNSNCL